MSALSEQEIQRRESLNQLRQFRLGARANDEAKVMRTIAAKLTDQEMEAVADYIQGLR